MANPRLCSIPDCGKPHDSLGYCGAHAMRLRRHGDPLGGGTPHHAPREYFLETVLPYTGDDCLIWPYARDMQGYAKIHVGRENQLVSRLICERIYGTPPMLSEAAHSCGKGTSGCVNPGHLSWKTHAENEADKIKHGTYQFGERNAFSKLTEDDVRRISDMKGTQRQIATAFGVSQSLISMIRTRTIWAHLS